MMRTKKNNRSQKGATLIEVAITILVLVIVMAAVFAQVDSVSQSTKRESMTMDMTQENRDFIDLFARDVHMSGYPVSEMYANTPAPSPTCAPLPSCSKTIAVGIVSASSTSLVLEGDVYGDGNVYSVQYKYYQTDPNTPPDPNCPCLRRSAMLKIDADSLSHQTLPKYYTEVQNVLDPGSLNEPIFMYYDAKGNLVDVTGGKDFENNLATIQQIDAIKVNLHVLSTQTDPQTRQQIVNSLSSVAELEN